MTLPPSLATEFQTALTTAITAEGFTRQQATDPLGYISQQRRCKLAALQAMANLRQQALATVPASVAALTLVQVKAQFELGILNYCAAHEDLP